MNENDNRGRRRWLHGLAGVVAVLKAAFEDAWHGFGGD